MLHLSVFMPGKNRNLAMRVATAAVLVLSLSGFAVAQQPGQATFSSPEDASQALFSAAQRGDTATLLEIFGPAGNQIISSGDEVQDKNNRELFVSEYEEMHRTASEPDGTTTLYIGAENWPLPVPLTNKGGKWYFESELGKKQVLFRRIGRNELDALRVLEALVDGQNDYYAESRDGKSRQYAATFGSDQGKHNGLYWKASEGEPESPIGPLIVEAAAEGYQKRAGEATPFHGYFYRILTRQGKNAPGGAKNYIQNGDMTGGFAILAYPADYRSSGVMTFVVNRDGVIYQKDLGPKTAELATAISEYAPDKTWRKAE